MGTDMGRGVGEVRMAGAGVEPARQEDAQDHVRQRPPPEEVKDDQIEPDLCYPVVDVHTRQLLRLDEDGPERVGEDLAAGPERLGDWTADEFALQPRRDVCVDAVHALELVVIQVVAPERDGVRNPDGPVGHKGEEPVVQRRLEEEVVRELVDREKERLVPESSREAGGGG
eukprot:scaffold4087_cov96-Isochrysis_galbana.AAC.2